MLEKLDSVSAFLSWLCLLLASVALVSMTVIFGYLVFFRYVLNETPTWVEQAALLLVMVITFLGAAAGVYHRSHLSVGVVVNLLPEPLRRLTILVGDVLLGVFGVVTAWYAYQLVVFKWSSQIPLLNLPEGLRALPLAISGVLVALFSVRNALHTLAGSSPGTSEPTSPGD